MSNLNADNSLAQWWVEDFESFVHHLGQQEISRLRPSVRNRTGTGNIFNYERLSKKDMEAKTVRNETLAETSTPAITHSRVASKASTWRWFESVDRADIARILTDPESEYMMSATMAFGRQIDTILANAAVDNGNSSTPYNTIVGPAASTRDPIGGSAGGAADTGTGIGSSTPAGGKLTVDDLRAAKAFLDANEVGVVQGGMRYCWINAKGLQDLLEVTEVASYDYNSVKALVRGEVDTFMGFKFIRTELLPAGSADNVVGAGKVGMVALERSSMGLSISDEKFTRVGEDPSIGFSTRVYCETTMGACRVENEGIFVINIDPT